MSIAFETTNPEPEDKEAEVKDAAARTPAGSSESQEQSQSETEFDPGFYEETFGLPAGSLKDVTDAQSALDMIRTYTDRTLITGLAGFSGGADIPDTKAASNAEQRVADDKKAGAPTDFEKLKAELRAEWQTELRQQQEQAMMAETTRRVAAKIDSWGSPKYGVGNNRNYKQAREAKRLIEMVFDHARVAAARGEAVTPEATLERLRLIDDETYVPSKGKAQVGTPGAGGKMGAKGDAAKMPRSIHEALMQNKT